MIKETVNTDCVGHGFFRSETLHVIVFQQPGEEIQCFIADELLIFSVNEALPGLLGEAAEDLELGLAGMDWYGGQSRLTSS